MLFQFYFLRQCYTLFQAKSRNFLNGYIYTIIRLCFVTSSQRRPDFTVLIQRYTDFIRQNSFKPSEFWRGVLESRPKNILNTFVWRWER